MFNYTNKYKFKVKTMADGNDEIKQNQQKCQI